MTMDSDSESQDSDEGRRFRFETTRKDSCPSLHSRRRGSSPARTDTKRRSRSIERNNRDRRNVERTKYDYKKNSQSSLDVKRFSSVTKHLKEINDSTKGASRHKDNKNSKDSSNSSSNHKESKFSLETTLKNSQKELRSRERNKRRSDERSMDRNKRDLRERSRERLYQGNKPKTSTNIGRSLDETRKHEFTRKISRKNDDLTNVKNLEETNINSETESNLQTSSPSTKPECKDLNLSDFDIVSDIEENSSDNSAPGQTKELTRTRSENSLSYEIELGIKKRVSKQHYERLLKRQAVKNRRSLEELQKVKGRSSDNASGTSDKNLNTNSSVLSDSRIETPKVSETSVNLNVDRKEISERRDDKNVNDTNSNDSQSTVSTYSSILPLNSKCANREELNDANASVSKEMEKIAPRIIGPSLPAHLRKSVDDDEIHSEDTFGPALPPHLEHHKSIEQDSDYESKDLPVFPGNVTKKEDSACTNQAECVTDDDDMMGPLPPDHPALENDIVQQQLELRARRLKAELAVCDNENEKRREEWMIELPLPQTVNLGLGPRKFRVRPAPDMSDRSSWTDTPADKARKRMEKFENRSIPCEPAMSQECCNSNASNKTEKTKKREKSLLEIHQKKLHKKQKKEEKEAKKIGKTVERRPFDRDVDLQVNRFDEARKKSVFLKARELDDRFSHGKI